MPSTLQYIANSLACKHIFGLDVTLRHSHAPQRIPVKNDPFPGFKLTGGTSYTSEITVTGNLG